MVVKKNTNSYLANYLLIDDMCLKMDIEKSHHSWIIDSRSQREYLDMFSMFASQSIGYNHPYIIANIDKLARVSSIKPALPDVYMDVYENFVSQFTDMADLNNDFEYVFFIEGGALAVENALKTAFDWKTRKNHQKGVFSPGLKVIHFVEAFHGRSGYTLSLTNTNDKRKTKYFPKHLWPRIENPKLRFPLTDTILEDVIRAEQRAVEQIERVILDAPHDIAAIIIEPIQGEGGDNHFRKHFFEKLREICDREDLLLIFDEVQTGFGITGKMWAYEIYGVKPDIVSFGKKAQVGGIFAGNRLNEVPGHVFEEHSRISSTYGGNLTDMVRCGLILDVYRENNLIENAGNRGKYFLDSLTGLQRIYPGVISNVRGEGLFIALDLPSQRVRDALICESMNQNLIVGACGSLSLRFRPHMTVTTQEIDTAMIMLERAVKQIIQTYGSDFDLSECNRIENQAKQHNMAAMEYEI